MRPTSSFADIIKVSFSLLIKALSMSGIIERQEKILESFSIERLSSSDINLRLVGNFSNPKSDSLTNKIQSDAFEEDENGSVAFYVIEYKGDGGTLPERERSAL